MAQDPEQYGWTMLFATEMRTTFLNAVIEDGAHMIVAIARMKGLPVIDLLLVKYRYRRNYMMHRH